MAKTTKTTKTKTTKPTKPASTKTAPAAPKPVKAAPKPVTAATPKTAAKPAPTVSADTPAVTDIKPSHTAPPLVTGVIDAVRAELLALLGGDLTATFGLRQWPGGVFRVDAPKCFVAGDGSHQIATQQLDARGKWEDFGRATVAELAKNIRLANGGGALKVSTPSGHLKAVAERKAARLARPDGSPVQPATAELAAAPGLRLPPVVDVKPAKTAKPSTPAAAANPDGLCAKCGRQNSHGGNCRTLDACTKRAAGAPAAAGAKATKPAKPTADPTPASAPAAAGAAPAGGWTKGARRKLAKQLKTAQKTARA